MYSGVLFCHSLPNISLVAYVNQEDKMIKLTKKQKLSLFLFFLGAMSLPLALLRINISCPSVLLPWNKILTKTKI